MTLAIGCGAPPEHRRALTLALCQASRSRTFEERGGRTQLARRSHSATYAVGCDDIRPSSARPSPTMTLSISSAFPRSGGAL